MKNTIKTSTKFKYSLGTKKYLGVMIHAVFLSSVGTAGMAMPNWAFAQEANQNAAGLNFVNADIESVIKAVGHYTGTTFVIDPRVKGQLTLVAEKPLTKDQAFKLLTSNLRMQGFAVVTSDGFSKIVPEADAKLQGGPTQVKSIKGDQIITQVFRINYEAANNIVTALRPLISPNNVINVNPGNNSIVITDYADNMRRMSEVIALLDVPSNPELAIIPIKHSIAADVATMVTRLNENSQASSDAGRTVILADSRTNSVLIKAPSVARSNLLKSLVAQLDQPTTLPGNVHVVYLKNAEAIKLAATLRSILSGDSSLPSGSNNANNSNSGFNTSAQPNLGTNTTQGNNSALSSTSSNLSLPISSNNNIQGQSGGAGGFIQADPSTNTLIITASDAVYRNLRGVIDQLDARRAQVYIESLIVEVAADKASDLGVQWMAATGDKTSDYRVGAATSFGDKSNNLLNLAAGNVTKVGSALPGAGLTVGLFRQINGQLGLGALAHALSTDGSSNILSIPNLVTLDNEEASIVVGQNVPFISGQFTSSGTSGANPFQTIERKEVGIKLKVKPQISEGGTVKLAIAQEVSNVDSTSNPAGIITNVRSLATNILAEDGQIIALGGLIGDDSTEGTEKVTFLGDLPLIGNLFKYRKNTRKKTNLLIFLRPTVIRNADQSNSISLDRYDYLRTQYLQGLDKEIENSMLKLDKNKFAPTTPPKAENAKDDNREGK